VQDQQNGQAKGVRPQGADGTVKTIN